MVLLLYHWHKEHHRKNHGGGRSGYDTDKEDNDESALNRAKQTQDEKEKEKEPVKEKKDQHLQVILLSKTLHIYHLIELSKDLSLEMLS